jgi:hypothetical protein
MARLSEIGGQHSSPQRVPSDQAPGILSAVVYEGLREIGMEINNSSARVKENAAIAASWRIDRKSEDIMRN